MGFPLFASTVCREGTTVEGWLEVGEPSAWGSAEKNCPSWLWPVSYFCFARHMRIVRCIIRNPSARWLCFIWRLKVSIAAKPLSIAVKGEYIKAVGRTHRLHSSKFKFKCLFQLIPRLLLSMRRRALQSAATGCAF